MQWFPNFYCMLESQIFKICKCGFKLEHSSSIDRRCDLDIWACKHSTNDFNVQLNVGVTIVVIKQSPTASQVQNSFIYAGKITSTTNRHDHSYCEDLIQEQRKVPST